MVARRKYERAEFSTGHIVDGQCKSICNPYPMTRRSVCAVRGSPSSSLVAPCCTHFEFAGTNFNHRGTFASAVGKGLDTRAFAKIAMARRYGTAKRGTGANGTWRSHH